MAGRDTLPAAVETPFRVASPTRSAGIGDHDLGVASTDDGLQGRGPSVAPAVGDDDRRAGQLVAHGEVGHLRAFEHGAPALVELAGRPPRDRRCVRVGCQVVGWLGRRGWRVGCRRVVWLPVGELVFKGLVDQAAHPGGDVDGFLSAESVEPAPHLGVDAEADGVFRRHAGILRYRGHSQLQVPHRDTHSQYTQCATLGLAMGRCTPPSNPPATSQRCRAVAPRRLAPPSRTLA